MSSSDESSAEPRAIDLMFAGCFKNAVTFGIIVSVATILSAVRFKYPPIPSAGPLPYPASKKGRVVAANP
ncbi:hypothetical protein EVAR_60113_1 [Eumeta japonica]|uniref:Uncharacterized protein n=1 Tax=Eumeta variegata TaxID=151549 RepID=A0A4C1Z254_EUMVA|nr:hypothetical protein EVAR_60113_1 [Eumeta japonica]